MSETEFNTEDVEIEKVSEPIKAAAAEVQEAVRTANAEAVDAVDAAAREAAAVNEAADREAGILTAAAEDGDTVLRDLETALAENADITADKDGETVDSPEAGAAAGAKKGKAKKVVKEIFSWILTFVAAFLIAIFINAYIFRISQVSGDSMQQTLQNNQTVFISRVPYFFSQPEYGDIVVFDHEQNPRNFFVEIKESFKYNIITMKLTKTNLEHKYWIKRVIGVPGDTIEIKGDGVYRNGVLLEEAYVNPAEEPNYSRIAGTTWVVGEGQLFVMGDNRNHSSDSRVIGLITINSVLGKVIKQ